MKVLHILDSLNRGGAETLALDVCRNAARCGLDMGFVATGGGELESEFERTGVPFWRMERRSALDRRLVRELRELIASERFDVVHCHQAVEALHVYLATRKMPNVRRVMSFHLCTSDLKNRVSLKFLAPRMQANVAVSEDLLRCLEHRAGFDVSRNFHVMQNGIDPGRVRAKRTGAVRRELGLSADQPLIGMVGNFYADGRKDQLTVCRAMAKVGKRCANAHLLFAGGAEAGSTFGECRRVSADSGIAERVHFLGSRTDVPEILAELDLFVFSSREDSFGIAVVEAMLAGCPVIVSDIPSLVEVTNGGSVASMFKTGDSDDLATRMIAMLDDPDKRRSLAYEAREWAEREFTIDRHIDRLKELYTSL